LITVTMSYVFHFWYIYIQIIHDMKCIIFLAVDVLPFRTNGHVGYCAR